MFWLHLLDCDNTAVVAAFLLFTARCSTGGRKPPKSHRHPDGGAASKERLCNQIVAVDSSVSAHCDIVGTVCR